MLTAVLALAALGMFNLIAIGAADQAEHQAVAVLIGVSALAVTSRLSPRRLSWLGWAMYTVAVLLLVAISFVGVSANGSRRWLVLGSVVLQPSELAKLGLLIVVASVLANSALRMGTRTLLALVLATPPVALTIAEPDLSTAALLVVVVAAALLLGRVRPRVLLALFAGGAALIPFAERLLRPYQLARLNTFLHSGGDPQGGGWSILQAHIAVASGGWFGLVTSPLHQLLARYLPARQTDLAFTSLVEQGGLLAGFAALLAALVLVWRLVAATATPRSAAGSLVAGTLAIVFGSEVAMSVAGNLGASPLAGVPFPFLSFGGTSCVVHLAAFGLILGARRDGYRRRMWRPLWRFRRRPRLARVSALALAVTLASLGELAWRMQQAEGAETLRVLGVEQMTRCQILPAPRGMIEDRHGVVVAARAVSSQVSVVPQLLRRDPLAPLRLASLLHFSPAALERRMAEAHDWLLVPLAEADPAEADRMAAANLPGVVVTGSPRRRYPYGAELGPLLGFVGIATPDDVRRLGPLPPGEIVGRAGLEREYDWLLRGQDGYQCVLVDPQGTPVAMARQVPPVPGGDLRLSIDIGLQDAVLKALQTALRGVAGQPRGDQGAALVMDPQSGEVLAMASWPAYDDNLFGPPVDGNALEQTMIAPGHPLLEHATQVALPPGSTYKLVVASADAVYRTIPPAAVIPTGYSFTLGNTTFHGWTWLPPQDLPRAVALSNDVYFYKLALALGPDRMAEVAQALGVGRGTGIDLPGESPGFLGTPERMAQIGETWYQGSTVILGIGQGYLTATPLQVARWTGAIASGKLVTPQLSLAMRPSTAEGFTALPLSPPLPLPFADQLGPVREGMRLAVLQGTGNQLRNLPLAAGAKTGTAEDPSSANGEPDAWFTAVAPMDQPEVVATAMVGGGGEGYYTAEPAVVQILRWYGSHRDAIRGELPMRPARPPRRVTGLMS